MPPNKPLLLVFHKPAPSEEVSFLVKVFLIASGSELKDVQITCKVLVGIFERNLCGRPFSYGEKYTSFILDWRTWTLESGVAIPLGDHYICVRHRQTKLGREAVSLKLSWEETKIFEGPCPQGKAEILFPSTPDGAGLQSDFEQMGLMSGDGKTRPSSPSKP
jgi:hypothetical protein